MAHQVRIARVYDEPGTRDGTRVLVDRLWPRGIRKEDLAYDKWLKDVAPSNELRQWYGHDPEKFDEFRQRYQRELETDEPGAAWRQLHELHRSGALTLLTSTKTPDISHAQVLKNLLKDG